MHEVTSNTLGEMVQAIVKTVHPEQIILFGSRGRGEAGPASDVDLLVVETSPFTAGHSRLKELARLERALYPSAVSTDILLFSRKEIEHWRTSLNHVISRALREGKVLYERS